MPKLCAHSPLIRVADGVYCVAGDADSLERPRRMTLFVLPRGGLAIHGGIRLPDDAMAEIEALGPVSYYFCVPNAHHDPDVGWFCERYPDAVFLADAGVADTFRKSARVDGTFQQDWPAELAEVLQWHTVAGTKFSETVLCHTPSRTLVVVDLAFNLSKASLKGRPVGRLFMKLNRAYGRFGITRLTEMLVRDPAALRASLETILEWDFDRVIVSHGEIVPTDGRRLFRHGFPKYIPAP